MLARSLHMTQYRRKYVQGGTFFFTVVTYQRQPFLTSPLGRVALRDAINSVRQRRPFTLDAIVLMTDHLHCVWTLPAGDKDYSTRWRQIKTLFTRRWLQEGGGEPPQSLSRVSKDEHGIWQRRFFEHTCRDEADMKRCIDYLHVNPLKHRLVEQVVDWPWSSFHRYVRLGEYSQNWGSADEWYGDEWKHYE
jgi:putative transposase